MIAEADWHFYRRRGLRRNGQDDCSILTAGSPWRIDSYDLLQQIQRFLCEFLLKHSSVSLLEEVRNHERREGILVGERMFGLLLGTQVANILSKVQGNVILVAKSLQHGDKHFR